MRVPVPDDYDSGVIVVAGQKDTRRGAADVVMEDRDHARNLTVYEDEEGRYVGDGPAVAHAVADFLGVDVTESGDADDETLGEDSSSQTDSVADAVERGECPWCDDYDGEHVGRHASSAHPDEWQTYKEGDD